MRFYEQLLFHLLRQDGLQYDSDDEEMKFDEAIRTSEIERKYIQDHLIEISDIQDERENREFFQK
jgi:hypothetical protein